MKLEDVTTEDDLEISNLFADKYNVREKVLEKAAKIRANLRVCLKNRILSLKVDCVTRLDRSILGLNVQYCENGVINIQTLAMKEVHVKHTSSNLTNIIVELLESYGVSLAQVCSITIDNAANMVGLGKFVNIKQKSIETANNNDKNEHNIIDLESDEDDECVGDYQCQDFETLDRDDIDIYSTIEADLAVNNNTTIIRCASHTLNLAVCDFLKEIESIRSKVKMVVKKLRTPTLLHLLRAEKLRKPVIECVTRWGSTYKMFLSLLELKTFCEKSAVDIKELHVSDTDWSIIRNVCSVLEPAYTTSIKLQGNNLLLSDLYFGWYSCKRKISKMWGNFSVIFSEALQKRGEILLKNPYVLAAVYLDPRYQVLLSNSEKNKAIQHITHVFNLKAKLNDLQPTEDTSMSSKFSTDDEIEEMLNEMGKNEAKPKNKSLFQKIKFFDNVKRLPHNVDVLQFWNTYADKELSEVAQIILAVPATQVSVERAFSTLKFILSDLRGNIDEDLLEDILLINLN